MPARLGEVLYWACCALAAALILYGLFGFSYFGDQGVIVQIDFVVIIAGLIVFGIGRAARRRLDRKKSN